MSDLSLLKAIASDFNRIDTIVCRNDFVKNKIRKEINDSPEKKKLDEFDDKAKKRLKSMTMVLLLFIVPAFLCIPLLAYDAINKYIIGLDPSLTFDAASTAAWDVILCAYLFFAVLLISLMICNFACRYIAHPISTVLSLFAVIAYIVGNIIIWKTWLYGMFWGVLFGIFWPIVVLIILALQLIGMLLGWHIINNFPGITLLGTLLLIICCVIGIMIARLLGKSIDSKINTHNRKKRELYLNEYENKKKLIRQKYAHEFEQVGYTYSDVAAKYAGNQIHSNDIKPDTVRKLIWCIENRYAYDIVGAKQWLAQQAHNKLVQKQLKQLNEAQERTYKMAEEASRDAWAARKAAEAPVDLDVDVTVRFE